MPPDELANAAGVSDETAGSALARSPLRGGIPAGQERISVADIAALYDAVLLGMRDYLSSHEQCASFVKNTDPWDAVALYHALFRAGVFDDPLTLSRFSLSVERALWQGAARFDVESIFAEVEGMLARLGVIPLNGSNLVRKP